jgi:uncharacterized protein YllA (UPF0747 family)
MYKKHFNFELRTPQKNEERLREFDREQEADRLKISEALRQYHKKLVDSGTVPNYI